MPKGKETKKNASLKVLKKKSTRLIRQEFMDYDYIDDLSPKDKQWLANFTAEYYNASVGKQSDEGKANHFMKSKEEVKDCTDRNNWRNNDVFGKAKAHNNLYSGMGDLAADSVRKKYLKQHEVEEAMVELLDYKRENLDDTSTDSDD